MGQEHLDRSGERTRQADGSDQVFLAGLHSVFRYPAGGLRQGFSHLRVSLTDLFIYTYVLEGEFWFNKPWLGQVTGGMESHQVLQQHNYIYIPRVITQLEITIVFIVKY